MKKYGRTIIVIAVLVALGLVYYYYLANKDTGKDATDIEIGRASCRERV